MSDTLTQTKFEYSTFFRWPKVALTFENKILFWSSLALMISPLLLAASAAVAVITLAALECMLSGLNRGKNEIANGSIHQMKMCSGRYWIGSVHIHIRGFIFMK